MKSRLILTNFVVQGLLAPQLRVEGAAELQHLSAKGIMDLQNGRFGSLKIVDLNPPSDRATALFDGAAYQYVNFTPDDAAEHFKTLFAWPSKVRYSASVYKGLQAFLQSEGYSQEATWMAYLEGGEDTKRLSGFRWCWFLRVAGERAGHASRPPARWRVRRPLRRPLRWQTIRRAS